MEVERNAKQNMMTKIRVKVRTMILYPIFKDEKQFCKT